MEGIQYYEYNENLMTNIGLFHVSSSLNSVYKYVDVHFDLGRPNLIGLLCYILK